MKRNLQLTGLSLLFAGMCMSTSCNKSGDGTTPTGPVCHIIQVDELNGSSTLKYLVNYDDQGRVTSVVSSAGKVVTFTYTGNTVVSQPNGIGPGVAYDYDSLILNSSGTPDYDYYKYNNGHGGTSVTGQKYLYNGDGTVASVTNVDSTHPNLTYQSSDGDITSEKDNFGNTIQYVYDTKYSSMDGDVMRWELTKVYGSARFFKTKHLWKGELNNPVTYVVDSTGKITTATPFSTSWVFYADKYTFTYECK